MDQNGHPDTLIATLNPPVYFHPYLFNHVFTDPEDTVLAANTTYAIVVRPDTPGTDLQLLSTSYDNEDTAIVDDWSIGDAFDIENGGSWAADSDGNALYIEVRGTVRVGPSLAPTALSATAVGDNRIDLSWTAPTDDGGSAITGYRIESSADGSTGWADLVADTGMAAATHSHTGLMPNTTRYYRVSAINGEGTSEPSGTANATTDYPEVTVQFGGGPYTVAEGGTQAVTVVLSEDPLQTTVIPLMATGQGGAESDDYSVPSSVTFNSGETSKPFNFTATQDDVDDDDESVRLTFGTSLPSKVSVGTIDEITVNITDDDDPQVTVMFARASYRVLEGDTIPVLVTLSANPEREVIIPITTTALGSTTAADYSVTQSSVTFNEGETSKTIEFTAKEDAEDDNGESVRLAIGGTLPSSVSEGTPSQTTVSIFADCAEVDIWCATAEFGARVYWEGRYSLYDNEVDNREFLHKGANYQLIGIIVPQNGHNAGDDNHVVLPFGIPERTKFYIQFLNLNATGLEQWKIPNNDWLDWTPHVSTVSDGETLTATLRFSEARRYASNWWWWAGRDIDDLRRAWKEGQLYKLRLVEDLRSERTPQPLNPPLYLRVQGEVNTTQTWLRWLTPQTRYDRVPPVDSYKIQWKQSSGSWDTPADISETTRGPRSQRPMSHFLDGLTPGVEYNIRVIATDSVGDSEPSNEVTYTKPASGQLALSNTPAEGEPRINGIPEAGQTLSADTTGIEDLDGLEDVVFQYRWLADDTDIASAAGPTYTVADADIGRAIRVRVSFTDDGGNEETLTSAPIVVTAGLQLRSATVNGTVLTLAYDEDLDTSVRPPDSAFAVNVNGKSRTPMGVAVGQSNVLLLLSQEVESADTVTVDYTAPDDTGGIQDILGRKADSFSGQAVTNNTAPADVGKSDPAQTPGSPDSLQVVRHESGQLRASWAAPDSGLGPTGYTLQWKESGADWADQEDTSGAIIEGTSHVITGLTDGVEYAVRVIATRDDAESEPSAEVTATPRDTTPPVPSSAAVDGDTLTITFDDALDAGQVPDKTTLAVTVAGASRGVDAASVSGSIVTITLVTAVFAGDAVTVDYTAPTDQSAARLQDLAGNAAASFSGQDVSNNTQAADRLTASGVPTSHDDHVTFELEFSEEFPLSYKTLRDHAFTVTGGDVTNARRLDPPSNVSWEIHVTPDGDGAMTIELPVTTDCTAEGAICTGDRRPLSSRLEVTVPGSGEAQQTPANSPAAGAPTITGTAQVGETLTADTTGISDGDGLDGVTFAYQWLAGDAEINGATASAYTLVDADEGKAISMQVSFTDDRGNNETLTSAVTGAVAPHPNTPATGAPTISGTAQVGETLTASTTDISDTDGLASASFSYQWLADDADISGATGNTYSVSDGDVGKTINVWVSFTDDAGNDEALTSAATAAVTAPETETQVPGTPRNLRAATGNSGELAVSWDAPSSDGGSEITGYRVQWKESSGSWDTPADVSETTVTGTAHTIPGLTDGTEYDVQVRAVNSEGAGEASPEAAATPVNPTPLTATVHDKPSSHDGSAAFTFELRFSENIEGLSYTTLQEHAFTVTGGSVSKARRLEPGKNVKWEITVQPSSNADVTIVLPITTDCAAQGAICTSDGRKLSSRVELTISGPSE